MATRGLTHTKEFDVVRITWESNVNIHVVLDRLDKEVLAYYQDQSGKPKYFDDLLDLALPTDDYEVIKKTIEPARGTSGFILDHNHHSHEYRHLYNPENPYLETHLYTLVPPVEDYTILYEDIENAVLFPHRALILERIGGNASIHYDLPSTQIDISKPKMKEAALRMDARLEALFRRVLGLDGVDELEKKTKEVHL